jgi:hypothetical protein
MTKRRILYEAHDRGRRLNYQGLRLAAMVEATSGVVRCAK